MFIRDYDNSSSERLDSLIQANGPQCAKVMIRLIGRIAKEMTVRYILTLIDDMLKVRTPSKQQYSKVKFVN